MIQLHRSVIFALILSFPVVVWCAPPNDSCQNAIEVNIGTMGISGSTLTATNDGTTNCGNSNATADVWYRVTSSVSGTVTINTVGSSYNNVLSVHDSCPNGGGTTKACSFNCVFPNSACVNVAIEKNMDYFIRVSGENGATGNLTLNVLGGSISGTVTDAATSAPIPGALVFLIEGAVPIPKAITDATGHYTVGNLPQGSFLVGVSKESYISELHNDTPCTGLCTNLSGNTVTVMNGQDTSGIDFALDFGGSITGTVLDAITSQPIANAHLDIEGVGTSASENSTTSDASGHYAFTGLPATSYFLRIYREGYVDQLYKNIPRENTRNTYSGTPIEVALGMITNINVSLSPGGMISGTVRDSSSTLPIQDVSVTAYTEDWDSVESVTSDASGNYTISGLPHGKYFVVAKNSFGYIDELHNNLPCVNAKCELSNGTPIAVTANNMNFSGIDFDLSPGGIISGNITDDMTMNSAISGIQLYDANGTEIASAYSDPAGNYSFAGLPAGAYRLTAGDYLYLTELYNNVPCPSSGCNLALGQTVTVTPPATTNVNFALSKGGSISGSVASAILPLENIRVSVVDSNGVELDSDETEQDGSYSLVGLSTGDYYVRVTDERYLSTKASYVGKVYANHICPGPECNPVGLGDLVHVSTGLNTPNVNFILFAGARIRGRITVAETGAPVIFGSVAIKDPFGRLVSIALSDGAGNYISAHGLPNGSFYAHTGLPGLYPIPQLEKRGLVEELFNNILCPNSDCEILSGTAVPVTVPGTTNGIDFILSSCSTMTMLPATLPVISPGMEYNQQLTTSGAPPFQFALAGGELPAGLSLSPSGLLSGSSSAQGVHNITITVEDANGCIRSHNYDVNVSLPYLFFDDFEDGILTWTAKKGSWVESSGVLQGTGNTTALAVAALPWSPSGANGCSVCAIEVDMETSGGPFNKTFLEGWVVNGGTKVDLIMKEQNDKWVLKHKFGGSVVASRKVSMPIEPGVNYHVILSFDGSDFQLFIDGNLVLTMPAGAAVPAGNIAFKVKNTTSMLRQILVY